MTSRIGLFFEMFAWLFLIALIVATVAAMLNS